MTQFRNLQGRLILPLLISTKSIRSFRPFAAASRQLLRAICSPGLYQHDGCSVCESLLPTGRPVIRSSPPWDSVGVDCSLMHQPEPRWAVGNTTVSIPMIRLENINPQLIAASVIRITKPGERLLANFGHGSTFNLGAHSRILEFGTNARVRATGGGFGLFGSSAPLSHDSSDGDLRMLWVRQIKANSPGTFCSRDNKNSENCAPA